MYRYFRNKKSNRDFGNKNSIFKKKFRQKKSIYMLLVLILLVISIYIFVKFDNKMKIVVSTNSEILAKTLAIQAIDSSIDNIIKEGNMSSEDFIMKNLDSEGKISTISANTVLINEICGHIAVKISEDLKTAGIKKVNVSLGTLTGMSSLANRGYMMSVDVLPSGTAEVNYNTEFYSVGINQINFQVWLNVDVSVNIISSVENKKVNVNRKLTLVDTVIRGDVPPNYINTTDDNALELIPNNQEN